MMVRIQSMLEGLHSAYSIILLSHNNWDFNDRQVRCGLRDQRYSGHKHTTTATACTAAHRTSAHILNIPARRESSKPFSVLSLLDLLENLLLPTTCLPSRLHTR